MEDWKIKLKLYFDENKIKIISAIVLILILTILIIGLNIDRKKAKQAETFVMNGTIVYETETGKLLVRAVGKQEFWI